MSKLNVASLCISCCLLAALPQYASAEEFSYEGEVTAATGALLTLTPPGTPVGGPVDITNPGPGGTAGPGDINAINVNVGGFCFSTAPDPGECPVAGAYVPVQSIDAAAVVFDANSFPASGTFDITTRSLTFGVDIPISFDLTAGTFAATTVGLGDVSGTGAFVMPATPATIDVTPNPAVFPDTAINTSAFLDVVVSNVGDNDLDITSVGSVDAIGAPFFITADACSGITLATGVTCTIQVQYMPTAAGPDADSFDIISTDPANPSVTVDVTGTVLVPDISVSPDPISFVTTTIGETTDVTVTVSNLGGADLDIGQISNPADTQFTVGTDTCSNTTVAATSGQCTFIVSFAPLTEATFMSSLDIPSNDLDTPVFTLNMSGDAITGAVAEIGVSTEALIYDELLVGQNASMDVIVTSSGNADLAIASLVFSGADAADFSQTNDCPMALVSTATCTVTVVFDPLTGGGAKSALLTIDSNADTRPVLDITLAASAFDGPRIVVDPLSLDFGSEGSPIDIDASTTASTTVSNTGNATLTIAAPTFVGGDGEFSVDSEDCTAGVAAGGSCTITVAFAPLTETDKMANMLIDSNDADNPQVSVALSGFVFRGPRLGVTSTDVDVDGDTAIEVGMSAMTDVVLQSTGTQDLTISAVTLGGDNADEFSITEDCTAAGIPSGQSCTVGVTATPTTAGGKTATLTITHGGGSDIVITLTAVAVDPPPPPPAPLTVPPAFATSDVGGTGSAGWLLLGGAFALLVLRRRSRFKSFAATTLKGSPMRALGKLVGMAAIIALPQSAGAIGFESESGDWYGSWDTTLSYGLAYRLEAADADLIGTINGGTKFSVNGDDGTLNFNRSIYSNALKATSELELNYGPGNLSFFMRGFYFNDFEIEDGTRERTPLSQASLDRAGSDGDLLDAFVSWKFDIGDKPAEFRVGEQVINWGESTFIQGGANVINHINVSALRVPGAELREALLPQDLVFFSAGLTPNFDIEVVYQYDWDKTAPDAVGTYFSTNDFAVAGGTEVRLGFADTPDFPNPDFFPFERGFNSIPRGPTVFPSDDGQWGWAARYFAPDFNNGTEFGFYYYNYHSRLPLISARTGSFEGLNVAAGVSVNTPAILGAAGAHIAANPGDVDGAIAAAVALGVNLPQYIVEGIANAAVTGGNVAVTASAYATDAFANTPSTGTDPFNTPAGGTSHFFTSYPEDIQLYALSINTTIGQTALQGEIAHHRNRPLQVDDLELLFAGLSPLRPQFAELGQLGSFSFLAGSPQFNPNAPPLTTINGYRRRDYTQADMALTRLFGPMLGADQGVLLFELAYHHVHGFPSKDVLRFDGPATVTSGSAALADLAHPGKPIETADHYPDEDSYGYRLAGRLDFSNIFGTSFNMATRFSWQHDVDGITPGPAGAFLEGRKAITIGNRFSYQNRWELDFSYTSFFGAGRYNEIHDRDFVASNIKYTF